MPTGSPGPGAAGSGGIWRRRIVGILEQDAPSGRDLTGAAVYIALRRLMGVGAALAMLAGVVVGVDWAVGEDWNLILLEAGRDGVRWMDALLDW